MYLRGSILRLAVYLQPEALRERLSDDGELIRTTDAGSGTPQIPCCRISRAGLAAAMKPSMSQKLLSKRPITKLLSH